jgi:hypothetical protein
MSHDEVQKEIAFLRDNPDAGAAFTGLLEREELGINLARQLWDTFNTRRMSLR